MTRESQASFDLGDDLGADAWGTHEFVDFFVLECHRVIASELARDLDVVLTSARDALDRWLLASGGDPDEASLQREWRSILHSTPVTDLCAILVDSGENATRLRQSSPFTAVLSRDLRDRILDDCETRFRHPAA